MPRCQCIAETTGEQCGKSASKKEGTNHLFCNLHQKCVNKASQPKKSTRALSKKSTRALPKKSAIKIAYRIDQNLKPDEISDIASNIRNNVVKDLYIVSSKRLSPKILEALSTNTSINTLEIDYISTIYFDELMLPIKKILSNRKSNLMELKINTLDEEKIISDIVITDIAKKLESNKTVTKFHLITYELYHKTIKGIAKMLIKNDTIKELDLDVRRHVYHNAPYLNIIFKALIGNNTLTKLKIHAPITNRIDISEFGEMMKKNDALEYIDLTDDIITNVHMKIIANALIANRKLKSIDVKNNPFITDDGGNALAKALVENYSIKEVNVDGTQISDAVKNLIKSNIAKKWGPMKRLLLHEQIYGYDL